MWIRSPPEKEEEGGDPDSEVALAPADMASGKADGSLLTITSSPMMLQERGARSTCYILSPLGEADCSKGGARSQAVNKPARRTGALIVYQIHRSRSIREHLQNHKRRR